MANRVVTREVAPIIQAIRTFLLGQPRIIPLRFQNAMAERPGPDANLPEGVHHKVAQNYYFTRDARREVTRPEVVVDGGSTKAIAAGTTQAVATGSNKPKTPGALFKYSE